MPKHQRSASPVTAPRKRIHTDTSFSPIKVAAPEAAAAVDADPSLKKLLRAMDNGVKKPSKGKSIVCWMRMGDLRISDNRALSLASAHAKREKIPLLVVFIISPQDYIAHDRAKRRIDFTLRSLASIKDSLRELHIPLHVLSHDIRRTLPLRVVSELKELGCTNVYANLDYEVDELRRDLKICSLATQDGIRVHLFHNRCVVEPGVVQTKDGRSYSVYSPYLKAWINALNSKISHYLEDCASPQANDLSIHDSVYAKLFDSSVPTSIPGFELSPEDASKMKEIWPAGEAAAAEILQRFLSRKGMSAHLGAVDPINNHSELSEKHSRVSKYDNDRDRVDRDTTSRLSVYLSTGVISPRACVRATMALLGVEKVDAARTNGVGRWVQEVAWRDFYNCVLTGYPRVSMGRPFLEKFASVVWEDHKTTPDDETTSQDSDAFGKWKSGMTGVPIVDAAMRCMNQMGWMHNRLRMITAMFLTKDLMIDWRAGERYFMEQLIDGDLASNNGGWQWSASTGVDPCPYFRIFNPYSQSLKADPTGEFIRHWVPELEKLRGPELHNPSPAAARKLGYPLPIVRHDEARQRALRRFKVPGDE